VEGVERLPDKRIGSIRPDDRPDPGVELAGALLLVEVGVSGDLPVDAEHRAWRGVDQHLPAGVPRRIEVEATLSLPPRERDLDVADEEPVVVALAGEPNAELPPQVPGAGPSGQDDVGSPHLDFPVAGPAGEGDTQRVLADGGDHVAPTLLDEGRGRHLRGEDLFDAGLREVDEGREPRLPSRSEGEAEQFLVLIVGPSR
jgi:hypothetical protein